MPASAPGSPVAETQPADLVELAVLHGSYGVRGWVKLAPFSGEASVLQAARSWWLLGAAAASRLDVTAVRPRGKLLLAKWSGCDTPEAADRLTGYRIAVARSDFPALSPGEYYGADLIGARVVNRQGVELGTVVGLRATAAQDLLEVGAGQTARLVPMVAAYVDAIDLDARVIRVDWQADWA